MLDLTAQQTYTRPLPTTTTHDHSKPCGPHAVPCARPIHDSRFVVTNRESSRKLQLRNSDQGSVWQMQELSRIVNREWVFARMTLQSKKETFSGWISPILAHQLHLLSSTPRQAVC